jgi:hypothetical protein
VPICNGPTSGGSSRSNWNSRCSDFSPFGSRGSVPCGPPPASDSALLGNGRGRRGLRDDACRPGLLDAVGDLDLDLGAPFADQRDVVLGDDHPHQRGGPSTM